MDLCLIKFLKTILIINNVFTDKIKTFNSSKFYKNTDSILTKKFKNKNINKFYYENIKKFKNKFYKK